MIRTVSYLVLLSVLLTSCATMSRFAEPPAQSDAIPPDDYNPTFIQSIEEYDENVHKVPGLEIQTVDVRQPNLVKIKMNILGNNNTHLKGISAEQFKDFWCEIVDSIDGKEIVVKKPRIYEVKEQEIDKLALAIVMDHSGSMGEERAIAVQNAVAKLIEDKTDNEKLALIKYDDRIFTESDLTDSKTDLLSRFKQNGLGEMGGWTAIVNGVGEGIEQLKQLPKYFEKALIVFTDGWDNSSTIDRDSLIQIARQNNLMICAVDFGDNINPGYMEYFADSTSGIYKHIYLTEEFQYLFDDLYNRLKNYYVIEYKPNEFGNHKVHFKLCFPDDTITQSVTYNNIPDVGALGTLAINYDFNKANISKESLVDVEQLFVLMKAFPKMIIELRGHTDSLNRTGDPEHNLELSENRAKAVKKELVKKGIHENRIYTVGLGEKEPVATNETEEGRARNRRTEFVIKSK